MQAAGKTYTCEASKALKAGVDAKLAKAERENSVVYHEKVTSNRIVFIFKHI